MQHSSSTLVGRGESESNAHKNYNGGENKRPSAGGAYVDGVGGDGGEEAVSAAGLARAIVDFPLPCEGLVPLVAATATPSGAQDLLKQIAFQAKEAVNEAEKVGDGQLLQRHNNHATARTRTLFLTLSYLLFAL